MLHIRSFSYLTSFLLLRIPNPIIHKQPKQDLYSWEGILLLQTTHRSTCMNSAHLLIYHLHIPCIFFPYYFCLDGSSSLISKLFMNCIRLTTLLPVALYFLIITVFIDEMPFMKIFTQGFLSHLVTRILNPMTLIFLSNLILS